MGGFAVAREKGINMPMIRLVLLVALLMATGRASAGSLHNAVMAGDAALVETLLNEGAAVDEVDRTGGTPLLLAVTSGNTKIAELLLKSGASVNAQAKNKDTPWLLAGASGRTDMLKMMWPLKPDLTIRNRFGGNALIPACERGHVDTVAFLLTTDIDVDHVNDLGWTCLLEAVILGDGAVAHQDIVKMVLHKGADPNLADKQGVTAHAHAIAKGQSSIAALLQAEGGR